MVRKADGIVIQFVLIPKSLFRGPTGESSIRTIPQSTITDMNLPASEILSTYVYRIGLLNGDYGYSTAVGLFNSVVNVILLVFVNWVVKKLNDGEGL